MTSRHYLLANTALMTTLVFGLGVTGAIAADQVDPAPVFDPPAIQESLPAVSGLNGKLEISGGGLRPGYDPNNLFIRLQGLDDFDPGYRAKAAVSVPLGHAFGLQVDGVLGSIDSKIYGHAAGHLFWRDPAVGLIGAYGSWTVWDSVDSYRTGVEGEYYAGQFTGSGVVGYEFGDVDNGLFSIADLNFYASDDFKVSVGHRYAEEIGHSLAMGAEYQFASTQNVGYAAFVDGRIGENNYQSIFAGLRLYFGQDKSLIRRHREDDPAFRDEPDSVVSCVKNVNTPSAVMDDSILPPTPPVTSIPCNQDAPPPPPQQPLPE